MSKQVKRILALLLAVVMVIGLSACAGGGTSSANTPSKTESKTENTQSQEEKLYYNKEGFPICDETITIEVTGVTGNTLDWNKTQTVAEVEKQMGIKMNCTTYADQEIFSTQYAIMLTSNKLPDLFIQLDMSKSEINKNGEDGYLLNMADYLDLMPNFSKFMDEHPDFAKYTKTADGKIYSFNRCRDTWYSRAMSWIYASNADLDKYGIDMSTVKTVDDFYNVLKSVKQQNPDAIPLSLTFGGQSGQRVDWMLKAAFGVFSVSTSFATGVNEAGEVFLYDTTDNWRAYLSYMHKLYNEKLLDNEAFIQTTDNFRSKIQDGTAIFWGDWANLSGGLANSDPALGLNYYFLAGLTSDYNKTPTYLYYPEYTTNARVWVSADTKYPEAICRLIDYPFSDEGQIFFQYGVEGQGFNYTTDSMGNKIPDTTYAGLWDSTKYDDASKWHVQEIEIGNALQMLVTSTANKLIDAASDDELQKMIDDEKHTYTQAALCEQAIRRDTTEKAVSMPFLVYTSEESEKRATLATDIKNELTLAHGEFIRGERDIDDDATWENFKKSIDKLGIAELLAIDQAAYDRFSGKAK